MQYSFSWKKISFQSKTTAASKFQIKFCSIIKKTASPSTMGSNGSTVVSDYYDSTPMYGMNNPLKSVVEDLDGSKVFDIEETIPMNPHGCQLGFSALDNDKETIKAMARNEIYAVAKVLHRAGIRYMMPRVTKVLAEYLYLIDETMPNYEIKEDADYPLDFPDDSDKSVDFYDKTRTRIEVRRAAIMLHKLGFRRMTYLLHDALSDDLDNIGEWLDPSLTEEDDEGEDFDEYESDEDDEFFFEPQPEVTPSTGHPPVPELIGSNVSVVPRTPRIIPIERYSELVEDLECTDTNMEAAS